MAAGGEASVRLCGYTIAIMADRKQPKAMVLIVVVYIVAALNILAYALAFRSRIAMRKTELLIEKLQQEQLAFGACAHAGGTLAADDAGVDYFGEPWCGLHEVELNDISIEGIDAVGGGWQLIWELIDESSKINVNLASGELLRGLGYLDEAAIASLRDWIDEDDSPNPDGAETSYYSGLVPSYKCKNSPIESPDELLLIKGLSAGLYFGDSLSEDKNGQIYTDYDSIETADTDMQDGVVNLSDLLTVYGDGRININTVSRQVLEAVPLLSDSAVKEIITIQQNKVRKFSAIEEIESNDNFTPADKLTLIQIAKFNSDHFRLHIKMRKNARHQWCEFTAIIERYGEKIRLLRWERGPKGYEKDATDVLAYAVERTDAPLSGGGSF
jgi:hypothetical protein